MTRKSKTLSNYRNVKKKIIIKNKSFNNCRELLKNIENKKKKKIIFKKKPIIPVIFEKNKIKFEVINPLFKYLNNEKNINTKKQDDNKAMNNKKQNKILNTIKETLDNKEKININKKQLIVYKNKIIEPKRNEKIVTINNFMRDVNNQIIITNKQNPNNLFKPKLILKPRKRYRHNKNVFHRKYPPPLPPKIKKEKVTIEKEINNIEELLQLIEDYPIKPTVEYNINMLAIHNIKKPLVELNSMIGMNKLKQNIVDQILYFIQDLHKISNSDSKDYMHTVIYGPPGTGKTETAKIMGKIFSGLGVLKKNRFKKVTRSDLIAGYLGQTALKTQDVIKDSLGGVLFIDEAYALGNIEKRDSFAKECIDTLCEALSDHKDDLMVIIAGYKDELEKCFFAYNSGLTSRFTWRFKTDDYTYKELYLIFKKKVNDINWKLSDKITEKWFQDKKDDFQYYGRDIETFLSKAKICHSRRVFCLPREKKTILTKRDLNKAFDLFKENNNTDEYKEIKKNILHHMYV